MKVNILALPHRRELGATAWLPPAPTWSHRDTPLQEGMGVAAKVSGPRVFQTSLMDGHNPKDPRVWETGSLECMALLLGVVGCQGDPWANSRGGSPLM